MKITNVKENTVRRFPCHHQKEYLLCLIIHIKSLMDQSLLKQFARGNESYTFLDHRNHKPTLTVTRRLETLRIKCVAWRLPFYVHNKYKKHHNVRRLLSFPAAKCLMIQRKTKWRKDMIIEYNFLILFPFYLFFHYCYHKDTCFSCSWSCYSFYFFLLLQFQLFILIIHYE